MRKPLMAGNWKMFKTAGETSAFFQKFLPLVAASSHADIVLAAPFVNLPAAVAATASSRVEVAAQNLFWMKEGAYTGEVSGPMLTAAGVRWVIIGHSERRQFFHESDEMVLKRTEAAIECGLKPIVCVGEKLEERERGETGQVLSAQFAGGLAPLSDAQFAGVVIAYEPVWAIGTGRTATPEIAADAHRTLRGLVRAGFGESAAASCRILYGGSVKPDNVQALMAQPEIDGALVGGASLDAVSFSTIVNF